MSRGTVITTAASRAREIELLHALVAVVRPRPYNLPDTLDLATAKLITADLYDVGDRLQGLLRQYRPVWEHRRAARDWLPAVSALAVATQTTAARWRVTLVHAVRFGPLGERFVVDIEGVTTIRRDTLTTLTRSLLARGVGAAAGPPRPDNQYQDRPFTG